MASVSKLWVMNGGYLVARIEHTSAVAAVDFAGGLFDGVGNGSSRATGTQGNETMGKLVVTEFITLDGVIEGPGGVEEFEHAGWSFKFNRGDDGDKFKFDELMAADAQLLGRVTYQGFAKAWPTMNGDEFGQRMNGMPKYVVSRTLS